MAHYKVDNLNKSHILYKVLILVFAMAKGTYVETNDLAIQNMTKYYDTYKPIITGMESSIQKVKDNKSLLQII